MLVFFFNVLNMAPSILSFANKKKIKNCVTCQKVAEIQNELFSCLGFNVVFALGSFELWNFLIVFIIQLMVKC